MFELFLIRERHLGGTNWYAKARSPAKPEKRALMTRVGEVADELARRVAGASNGHPRTLALH